MDKTVQIIFLLVVLVVVSVVVSIGFMGANDNLQNTSDSLLDETPDVEVPDTGGEDDSGGTSGETDDLTVSQPSSL